MDPQRNPSEPSLCAAGCGFYGNAGTQGYCSVCYKARMSSQQQALASPAAPAAAAAPKAEPQAVAVPAEAPAAEAPVPAPPAAVPEVAAETAQPEEPGKPSQANRSRCFSCKKKVGLLGFECRCGYVFCSGHRHAQDHACTFDYASFDKERLAKANPQVAAAKIDKL